MEGSVRKIRPRKMRAASGVRCEVLYRRVDAGGKGMVLRMWGELAEAAVTGRFCEMWKRQVVTVGLKG